MFGRLGPDARGALELAESRARQEGAARVRIDHLVSALIDPRLSRSDLAPPARGRGVERRGVVPYDPAVVALVRRAFRLSADDGATEVGVDHLTRAARQLVGEPAPATAEVHEGASGGDVSEGGAPSEGEAEFEHVTRAAVPASPVDLDTAGAIFETVAVADDLAVADPQPPSPMRVEPDDRSAVAGGDGYAQRPPEDRRRVPVLSLPGPAASLLAASVAAVTLAGILVGVTSTDRDGPSSESAGRGSELTTTPQPRVEVFDDGDSMSPGPLDRPSDELVAELTAESSDAEAADASPSTSSPAARRPATLTSSSTEAGAEEPEVTTEASTEHAAVSTSEEVDDEWSDPPAEAARVARRPLGPWFSRASGARGAERGRAGSHASDHPGHTGHDRHGDHRQGCGKGHDKFGDPC